MIDSVGAILGILIYSRFAREKSGEARIGSEIPQRLDQSPITNHYSLPRRSAGTGL